MIKLQITRYKENENFEEEVKIYRERNRAYMSTGFDDDFPKKEIENKILEVEVTEEQFEAIRKAVLENF